MVGRESLQPGPSSRFSSWPSTSYTSSLSYSLTAKARCKSLQTGSRWDRLHLYLADFAAPSTESGRAIGQYSIITIGFLLVVRGNRFSTPALNGWRTRLQVRQHYILDLASTSLPFRSYSMGPSVAACQPGLRSTRFRPRQRRPPGL